jgi:hypothetical protein
MWHGNRVTETQQITSAAMYRQVRRSLYRLETRQFFEIYFGPYVRFSPESCNDFLRLICENKGPL